MRFYDRQAFHDYEGVAIDLDEQARLVRDLGPHKVMLMRNHGILTVGRTPGEAFMLLYYFERAARIQLQMQAAAAAGAALVMPPHEVCEKAARQFWELQGDILIPGEREWPALMRQLARTDPSYRNCPSTRRQESDHVQADAEPTPCPRRRCRRYACGRLADGIRSRRGRTPHQGEPSAEMATAGAVRRLLRRGRQRLLQGGRDRSHH